jgi:hypothetical protein
MSDQTGDDALDQLDAMDKEHGVNTNLDEVVKEEPIRSLGKAKSYEQMDQLSAVAESDWKLLNLKLLPSSGMFYPDGVELMIKSAKTKEIRHWSTMDEHDPIDVREKINFILNKLTKFKIKGDPHSFNFNDYAEVDKYHLLFRIHELTFPNQENKLMANIKCDNKQCNHVNRIQVNSQNLLGFEIPKELEEHYSPDERCFVINSEKLQETIKIYLPTSGITSKFRQKKKQEVERGIEIDKSFYDTCQYLVYDWRGMQMDNLTQLKHEANGWSDAKFTVIYKISEMLKKSSVNRATGVCEKCKTRLETSIFLGGSFTVKDIFIVSARLNELI